ncbi:MAG: hypothetical protein ABFC24_06805 [Methanoregulaceae archaeon]
MAENDEIPYEAKWKVAGRLAAAIPVMYDFAFRETVGDRYDVIERDIWLEIGKEVKIVADSFRLPAKTPGEIVMTLQTVATIFFGPDWVRNPGEAGGDQAVLLTKRCPFRMKEEDLRGRPDLHFQKCLAFSTMAVENLNRNYTVRFVRSMCMGDKHCEMKIVRKEPAKDKGETGKTGGSA